MLIVCFFVSLPQATSPQTGGQQTGGSLKSMKEKPGQAEKEVQEGSGLKTAGPEGEITAGLFANYKYIMLVGSTCENLDSVFQNPTLLVFDTLPNFFISKNTGREYTENENLLIDPW